MDILKVTDVDVSYGAIHALKNVNITVKENSITTILGSNGGGKSTLLKSISRLLPLNNGSIEFEDKDITKLSPEKVTQMGIIHVPEGRQIFGDITVYENLMIGAFTVKKGMVSLENIHQDAMTPRIKKLIETNKTSEEEVLLTRKEIIHNNLMRVYDYFPVLKERKDQVAMSLSGGEQQMLAIGRALMGTPKLLILDEPSLGLAPLIVKNIFNILKQLRNDGITILIVEQNALQTLKIADYAYVIRIGDIIKQGKASDMINDPELLEAYLGK
ncbi:ABC transporter ATP-binding protein [Haloplasma contractile]|uniref:ABC transporter ATP-binding protein n=1 Tax=Haloplasma contractile SSD-17B TaxID=1033810 RepID=U2E9J2_9MOLU|nr:ABC transporter ATP-binding protein [Haloplasma contractile]ERJ11813.1 ABC transporter ATP-binding protein [Haloplasma contractile SSD-17B]